MRKMLSLSALVAMIGCGSLLLTACGNDLQLVGENRERLIDYKAALWKISPEAVAAKATAFSNAIQQYDKVIHANMTSEDGYSNLAVDFNGKDQRIVRASKDSSGNYQVTYDRNHFDKSIPVVVADLDETFLDDSLHTVYNALNRDGFNVKNFHKWTKAARAKIFPKVLEFVEHVWKSGGIVVLASDRNMGRSGGNQTGDELGWTRKNLIDQGYPAAFLDSYVWWMKGVLRYEDQAQGQTKENLEKLKSKENRYNYLNSGIKLQARTMEEMNLHSPVDEIWKDVNDNQTFNDQASVKIVMKVGDDLDDFNSNLLSFTAATDKLGVRKEYMKNKNILNLFGGIGPAIWFEKINGKVIEKIARHGTKFTSDQNLLKEKHVDEVIVGQTPLLQTYVYIAGNATYGHWLTSFNTKFGKNLDGIKKALKDYFNSQNGQEIWDEAFE